MPETEDIRRTPREPGRPPDHAREWSRGRRFGPTAAIAVAALVGLVVWLVVESRNGSNDTSSSTTTTTTARPVSISATGLESLAAGLPQPIYWVGSISNTTFELTRTAGRVYLRYLPAGAKPGDTRAFLTIGTYPVRNAYDAMKASSAGSSLLNVPGGGIASVDRARPTSVYLAFPGSDVQVEVFSPDAATARRLAVSGSVQPVHVAASSPALGPVAASPARLSRLSASLGHSVYWAGPRAGVVYELTQTSSGRTYIRYLPRGVAVGTKKAYLTVATYPMTNAFAAIQATARGKGAVSVKLPRGGFAVHTTEQPSNIHLAYPGADAQVEVYGPAPSVLNTVVGAGQIVPVG